MLKFTIVTLIIKQWYFLVFSILYCIAIILLLALFSDKMYNRNSISTYERYNKFEINNKRINLEIKRDQKKYNDIKNIINPRDISTIIDDC